MRKKAIVIGGSGFLGSYVADELTARNYATVIADIREPKWLKENQTFTKCDILNPSTIAPVLSGAQLVYNFAGMSDLDESGQRLKSTFELNVIGNIHILESCDHRTLDRYVYASSAYALSERGGYYGISKHTSERIIREFASRHSIPFTIIRYGSLYGARADAHNGIYRMLVQAVKNGKIVHSGDGEEVREYIHAVDASRLSVDIVEDAQYTNGHVVLTGVERLKHKDVLQMIKEITGDKIDIEYSHHPWEGHYKVTPYSMYPELGKKLIANPFIDLGQGLIDCLRHVLAESGRESGTDN